MPKLQIDGVDIAEIEGHEAEGLIGLAKAFGIGRLGSQLRYEIRRDTGYPRMVGVYVKPVEIAEVDLSLVFRETYL